MGTLLDWIDQRLPVRRFWRQHFTEYYVPANLNGWYLFGILALLVLAIQLLTGIWLVMSYQPSAEQAFASVQAIMRDVPFGWLLRHMHSTGASAFFIVVYLHLFRGLLYGSYRAPRELVWISGLLVWLVLMAMAFTGYLLPWGNMSYWGGQVIISLFGTIPLVGGALADWIRGDYLLSGITLNRFFALHVVALPLCLLGLILLHLAALRAVGSNNPQGVRPARPRAGAGCPPGYRPFWPYYALKDLLGVAVFLLVWCAVVFFWPDMNGLFLEPANYAEADPLQTPEHIRPLWYFAPFYAILRAVPDPLGGVFCMGLAVALLFVLPWLDRSPVRALRYKGRFSQLALVVWCLSGLGLGVLGLLPAAEGLIWLARGLLVGYFAPLLLMPVYTGREKAGRPPAGGLPS